MRFAIEVERVMRGIVQRDKPLRDPAHLKRVRELPCVCCLAHPPSVAHHISGRSRGMSQKIGDDCTISLCVECHTIIHSSSKQGQEMRKEQERWLKNTQETLART